MQNLPDRRTLLTSGLASLVWPCRSKSPSSPFTLGVASGDPSDDGFVIWTRLAPDPMAANGLGGMNHPVTVKWLVADDEALTHIVQSGEFVTHPDRAHTVHIAIEGLLPDRPYWYQFEALGVRSTAGRGRTLPLKSANLDELKIVVSSCARYELGYFSAYRHMAAEHPDYVLFLGDYIYENMPAGDKVVRRHDYMTEAKDLSGYRNRYALYRGFRPIRAKSDDKQPIDFVDKYTKYQF